MPHLSIQIVMYLEAVKLKNISDEPRSHYFSRFWSTLSTGLRYSCVRMYLSAVDEPCIRSARCNRL